MTEEEFDAAVDVIAAVDAGVLESLNQRIKQRNQDVTAKCRRLCCGNRLEANEDAATFVLTKFFRGSDLCQYDIDTSQSAYSA